MCKTKSLFNFRQYPKGGVFQPGCRILSRRNVGAETKLPRSIAHVDRTWIDMSGPISVFHRSNWSTQYFDLTGTAFGDAVQVSVPSLNFRATRTSSVSRTKSECSKNQECVLKKSESGGSLTPYGDWVPIASAMPTTFGVLRNQHWILCSAPFSRRPDRARE